jgi:peptidoglycan/xylan/chitin deacetylase (PgdA/CDA1 family)
LRALRPPVAPGTLGPGGRLKQAIVGLLALPLSILPFLAYTTMTPEGRLVRDRALVSLFPPSLPGLSTVWNNTVAERAPNYRGGVMMLAYHGIGSASDAEGGFVISARRFGEHLEALRAAGMNTVTAGEVADAFAGRRSLPPRAVMISFDDGRTDAMLFADPLLEQAGMSATMFVITGAASKPGIYYASWPRLEEYAGSGRWDLQSHTSYSHHEQQVAGRRKLPALTSRAPGESITGYRVRIRADLRAASADIEAHTGRRPVAFAYPFGAYGADRTNDPAIRRVLREEVERRYEIAFHQDEQESIPVATAKDDRLHLRRLEVEDWSGLELLGHISRAARTAGLSRERSLPIDLVAPGVGTLPPLFGTLPSAPTAAPGRSIVDLPELPNVITSVPPLPSLLLSSPTGSGSPTLGPVVDTADRLPVVDDPATSVVDPATIVVDPDPLIVDTSPGSGWALGRANTKARASSRPAEKR